MDTSEPLCAPSYCCLSLWHRKHNFIASYLFYLFYKCWLLCFRKMWIIVREEEITLVILILFWTCLYETKWKQKRAQSATIIIQITIITLWTNSIIPLFIICIIQGCQLYNVYNDVIRPKRTEDGVCLAVTVIATSIFCETRVAQTVTAIVMRHLMIHGNVTNQVSQESLAFLTDPCCCAGSWACLSKEKTRENIK